MRALLWRWMGFGDVVIRVYYTYSYKNRVYYRGRVLREDFVRVQSGDKWLRNLINMIRRLLSYELPQAELHVNCGDQEQIIHLDKEGFFSGHLSLAQLVPNFIQFTIPHQELDRYHQLDVAKEINIERLDQDMHYGIISDIDDTILKTGVTSIFKWRLIINTLFLNPSRRKTFKDTVELYQKLNSKGRNPFFYISNSPWNMYDYLEDYLLRKKFPKGILVLRDLNINQRKSSQIEFQNKYKEIVYIYNTFVGKNFILVGDAGEHDAQIYLRIAYQFPHRTRGIYIRKVKSKRRNRIIENLPGADKIITSFLLFEDTQEMLNHLSRQGLLDS